MKYSVYKYSKETKSYKFMDCMTLTQMRKNGINEEKRIKVGYKNIQKYIIK
jgi:hypothetical protein